MKILLFTKKNHNDLSVSLQKQIITSDKELMDFPWTAEHWQKIFLDFKHYSIVLMQDKEKLVGFILGTETTDDFHLLKIVVEKDYRRQGHAQKLLDFLIQWLEKEGKVGINLEVRRSNPDAIHFYQKNQFSILHEQPKFYTSGETALLMHRKLNP